MEGKIEIGCSSEQMLLTHGKVFAAFWSNYGFAHLENNKLMVIDTSTNQLLDSVIVGKEPNSMVLDKDGKLWVLCSGGFASEAYPTLWRVDPASLTILSTFTFTDINTSPTSLSIDGAGETLFFLNQGIFQMSISDTALPALPLVAEDAHLLYSLAINPKSNEVFATDAIDYQQRGLVLRYQADGTFIDSFRAGLIPGAMVFH
jgi:YVTN family beta-propeller protein